MTSRKKTTRAIQIYEEDLPILTAFMDHCDDKTEPEAFRFGVKLLGAMADDVKMLREASQREGSKPRLSYIE